MKERDSTSCLPALVVLGVLFALALAAFVGIALSGFLPAQTRARVATVQAEHRNIAVGLAVYREHYGRYPTPREFYDDTRKIEEPLDSSPEPEWHVNTPITTHYEDSFHVGGIMEVVPGDLFSEPRREWHYGYWSDGNVWVLTSRGPDRTRDVSPQTVGEWILSASSLSREWPATQSAWLYDPTNGIKSRGDIIKTGP